MQELHPIKQDKIKQSRAEIARPLDEDHSSPNRYYPDEEEISLTDLWNVCARQKKIILGFATIATIGAVLYALLAPFIYEAEVVFLPPPVSDIQAFNVQGVYDINTAAVYTIFKRNLSSRIPREVVFEKMGLAEHFSPEEDQEKNIENIFKSFNERLSVTFERLKKGEENIPFIALALNGGDPILTAEILNRIAEETDHITAAEIITNIQSKLDARKRDLHHEIDLLRDKVKKQRMDEIERLETADALERKKIEDRLSALRERRKKERFAEITRLEEGDRISRESIQDRINTLRLSVKAKRLDRVEKLKEASNIAHSLGIKESIDYKLKKINSLSPSKSQIMTDITTNGMKLYEIGFEAIESEMESLSNRKDDDPFISELRGLQDQLKELETNEKIEALASRTNDDDFIPTLFDLQEKLALLKHNRKAEQLKARNDDDPFISSLRDKQNEILRLESIHIDPATVKTARLDQAAYPPERLMTKRIMIVALCLILGLFLGVIVAFFRNFLETARKETAI